MKIGVIGSGRVGGTLGSGWAAKGHEVVFGSRDPQSRKMASLVASAGPNARAASNQEALDFAEVVILAVPGTSVEATVKSLHGWQGKIVLDTTNRFAPLPPSSAGSGGQDLARWSGARVVKAFNTIGSESMIDPDFGDQQPSMFYCGDDSGAKKAIAQLAQQAGFDPIDAGPLSNAVLLEKLAELWVHLAMHGSHGRGVAFKLLYR